MSKLNETDFDILRLLQEDSSLIQDDIGQKVGITGSAVARRVKALRKKGIIQGYRALLHYGKLGVGLNAYVLVSLNDHGNGAPEEFERALASEAFQCVLDGFRVTGGWDYLVRVVARDQEHYAQTLGNIRALKQVKLINSLPMLGVCKTIRLTVPFTGPPA